MERYVIWATDCDGSSPYSFAPKFDTLEEAEAWVDEWERKWAEGEDITRMWVEEEHPLYHEVYGEYEGDTE